MKLKSSQGERQRDFFLLWFRDLLEAEVSFIKMLIVIAGFHRGEFPEQRSYIVHPFAGDLFLSSSSIYLSPLQADALESD